MGLKKNLLTAAFALSGFIATSQTKNGVHIVPPVKDKDVKEVLKSAESLFFVQHHDGTATTEFMPVGNGKNLMRFVSYGGGDSIAVEKHSAQAVEQRQAQLMTTKVFEPADYDNAAVQTILTRAKNPVFQSAPLAFRPALQIRPKK
ncbi:MAG: hypothetical protein JWM96_252 [Alphaproteobacteria bacterium]|nr:hypothetical protein [Alphaproteobacteria bacterium]